MVIVKNTYGISASLCPSLSNPDMLNKLGGSSLERKKYPKKPYNEIEELLRKPLVPREEIKETRFRSMSKRTKSKIRKKLISFARIQKRQSFLTLTFCNQVTDSHAVKILADFLKNVTKQNRGFQYLWVAEKQTKNEVFKDNIHFHIITNMFWKIDKWWKYWLELQAKHGIIPRNPDYKPASAFDVRSVKSNNIKGIVNYLTKYVTKNSGQFTCQVWNCSKKISRLYTDFYTGIEFIRQLEKLEKEGQLGGELKVFPQLYCNITLIPLNRTTMNFYNRLDVKNNTVWNSEEIKEGVSND